MKETKNAPPYTSFTTFRNLLERLHQIGVPDYIERDVMGAPMNGSIYAQLRSALKYLRLISEDGKTTPTLDELATADLDDRKKLLRKVLESSYGFLFGEEAREFDLARTTTPKLRQRFEAQDISALVARKAMSFFLQAAHFAEVPLSSHIYTPKQFTTRSRVVRASRDSKPKQQSNGSNEGSSNTLLQGQSASNLENQIDDLMRQISAKPIEERAKLFERVRFAMHYAEIFGRSS